MPFDLFHSGGSDASYSKYKFQVRNFFIHLFLSTITLLYYSLLISLRVQYIRFNFLFNFCSKQNDYNEESGRLSETFTPEFSFYEQSRLPYHSWAMQDEPYQPMDCAQSTPKNRSNYIL